MTAKLNAMPVRASAISAMDTLPSQLQSEDYRLNICWPMVGTQSNVGEVREVREVTVTRTCSVPMNGREAKIKKERTINMSMIMIRTFSGPIISVLFV